MKTCGTCNTQQYFAAGSSKAQCKCTTRLQPSQKGTEGFYMVENVTKISMGDLVYSESAYIHPIFGAKNFYAVDYHTLKPVLRLVSAMLLSERSLRFIYTVMCGQYSPPIGCQMEGALHPSDVVLTADQRRAALRKLGMLASIIHFSPTDCAHDSEHGCSAVTRPDFTKQHPVLPNGYGSIIQFSQGFVDAIVADSTAAALGAPDNAARVWHIFAFAKTLGHEVSGHAANIAVRKRIAPREPFYRSYHGCSELGFHWENAVFGGLYSAFNYRTKTYSSMRQALNGNRVKLLDFSKTVVFTPYPQNANVREYLLRGNYCAVRGALGLFDVFTRTNIKTIANFLTSAYWAAEAQQCEATTARHTIPMLASRLLGTAEKTLAPLQPPRGPKIPFFHSAAMSQREYDSMLRLIADDGKGLVMRGQHSMQEVETQLAVLAMARQEISSVEAAELLRLTRMQSVGCSASDILGHCKPSITPANTIMPGPVARPMAVATAAVLNGSSGVPIAADVLIPAQAAIAVSTLRTVGAKEWQTYCAVDTGPRRPVQHPPRCSEASRPQRSVQP